MEKDDLDTVGGRVAYLLAASGQTAGDLSLLAGLSKPCVALCIRENAASAGTARALARLTGAKVGWILAGEGRKPGAIAVGRRVTEAATARGAAKAATS